MNIEMDVDVIYPIALTEDMLGKAAENFKPELKLSAFQRMAILISLQKDTLTSIVSIKTGGGKTYVFQVLQYALCEMNDRNQVVIVVSPLTALIKSQISALPSHMALH